jgi:hypothetical protein
MRPWRGDRSRKLSVALSLPRSYTTALRRAASQNHAALNFGVRFCVLKST